MFHCFIFYGKYGNEGSIIQATEGPFNFHLVQKLSSKKEKNRISARGGYRIKGGCSNVFDLDRMRVCMLGQKGRGTGETKDVGEEVYRCKPTDMRKAGIF